MNVLVILGHPRSKDSLCAALAQAYESGASSAGATVRTLVLSELAFDPNVHVDSPEQQALEPDLQQAAELLAWAEHLVFVYPTWWGTMPALLKGFLDRMLMPNVAFRYTGHRAIDYEGLWRDKSGQIITTMDTPPPIYRWIYKAPGTHAMRNATLGFCGVAPVRALQLGSVRTATTTDHARWLERARQAGWRLHRRCGTSPSHARTGSLATWLRALRLQFYPVTWMSYAVGALVAAGPLAWSPLVWGLVLLVLLEAATVFCNDYMDQASDRVNRNHGLFTGGSRVLVEGMLDAHAMRLGIAAALASAAVAAGLALRASPQPAASALWLLLVAVLALGYTAPPLRLSYRGLGEIDVALTHGVLVIVWGYLLQGGAPGTALPWLLGLPLFFAIVPAIILAGVPDRDADASVDKRTVAVQLGIRGALRAATAALIISAVLAWVFDATDAVAGLYRNISPFVLPHAALGVFLLYRHGQQHDADEAQRIDALLIVTLSYMVWFVALPLVHLLS